VHESGCGTKRRLESVRFSAASRGLSGHPPAIRQRGPIFTGSAAVRHALPALYDRRELAEAGGLMSYGSDLPDRQTSVYVGRILGGEKPAEMPVELPPGSSRRTRAP
jgi:hypothetical protein